MIRIALIDDMDGAALILIEEDDGDVIVSVRNPKSGSATAQFCTAQGGTRNPGVAKALRDLMRAINPITKGAP